MKRILTPSEMLFVERKKVIAQFEKLHKDSYIAADLQLGLNAFKALFGDKCLPDTEPSVQGEPKFKVGDKVGFISQNHEIGEIAAYFPDEKFCYSVRFGKEYHNMAEHQLEPYTEPEHHNLSQNIANCDKSEGNQLKDNMEKQKFDLFVHGDLLIRKKILIDRDRGATLTAVVPYDTVDTSYGVIIDGDVEIDAISIAGIKVGASGAISAKEIGFAISDEEIAELEKNS